jgi:hypothetical protein
MIHFFGTVALDSASYRLSFGIARERGRLISLYTLELAFIRCCTKKYVFYL